MSEIYKSNAEWIRYELNMGIEHNVTSDCHESEDEAKAVCRLLEEKGFGGEGVVFPVRTWVSPLVDI
jgi:hypothetical protein